ncbi:MAG: UDP-glucose 6-dehydrogenase [Myxococcales bacterium]
MKLAVVGTGYVGLVAGACFAETGNHVVCVDVDEAKVEGLKRGVIPIFEPGLSEIVERTQREGRIEFTTDLKAAVSRSTIVFLAVGTPPAADGTADLSYVMAAAEDIGRAMVAPTIVVIKSTVPIGTSQRVRAVIAAHTTQKFAMASNPEFLKEGAAIEDFLRPDRVIIGAEDEWVRQALAELYEPFVRTENPVLFMDIASAELAKYASNAMLATRISFMNEIAAVAEKVGADVAAVRRGMGSDPRIGRMFLFPGVGYGGSCFPKDIKALIGLGAEIGLELPLLRAVEDVNDRQKSLLVRKIVARYGDDLSGRTFALWGLAFKPNTDDMREAPSLTIIRGLRERGARVVAFDPVAQEAAAGILGDQVSMAESGYRALEGADALVLVTEWAEFRTPDFERIRGLLREPVVFDGRNIYSPRKMRELGFEYYCIGRPTA